jgi:hypothetical protein
MRIVRRVVWSRLAIFALLLSLPPTLVLPNSSFAACTNDPGAAQNASNFINNPSSLLNGPNGPRSAADISAAVRDFVAANPQALAAVIALLKDSGLSTDQQKAIGTGLGLAAGICTRPDPTFAAEIQTQLAGTTSADAKNAYAAVTGNVLIGSVGGGAGGGAGGSGGSAGGSTNPISTSFTGSSAFQAFTSNSASNTSTNFFSGGSTASGGGSASTTTNTTTNVTCTTSKTC